MSFTSNFFLIGLLPWFVLLYRWMGQKSSPLKKMLIFLGNSFFYVFGGVGSFIFICAYSIMIWFFVLLDSKLKDKRILAFSLVFTVLPLMLVKYTAFAIQNINTVFGCNIGAASVAVPLGISFFTFEAVSLLADVYWGVLRRSLICCLHICT